MDEPIAIPGAEPSHECFKTPSMRKRRSRVSISNEFSAKKQRLSIGPIDIHASPAAKREVEDTVVEPRVDRFISTRPGILFPMDTTPRTARIARAFGLIDDRVLKYVDPPPTSVESKTLSSIRRSASQLFKSPCTAHPTSAAVVLARRKQFVLALDGPGMPQDPWAYPLSWSRSNFIAVACGSDVYHQNLDTRQIAHLCTVPHAEVGRIRALAFAGDDAPDFLGLGTSAGSVQVFDARADTRLRAWADGEVTHGVGALCWRERELAVGRTGGGIACLDTRTSTPSRVFRAHSGDVYGLQWSPDGRQLLSADSRGFVHLWDSRNTRERIGRARHTGPVKALAWCPWKRDLFATGGTKPDGMIRFWSAAGFTGVPEPHREIATGTDVYSLVWAPHCRELLSTHGSTWEDPTRPFMNALAVHAYPTGRKVVSITAHTHAVSQSCLGPDGTSVFTICYREEAMKMWKVWAAPESPEKEESAFDRFSIR